MLCKNYNQQSGRCRAGGLRSMLFSSRLHLSRASYIGDKKSKRAVVCFNLSSFAIVLALERTEDKEVFWVEILGLG